MIWFVGAWLVFALSSWWALHAPRHALVRIPGATDTPALPTPGLSAVWWTRAFEVNGARRLPILEGDLLDVTFIPERREGWILGRGNLLIHTSDGGETWTDLHARLETPARAATRPAAPTNFGVELDAGAGDYGGAYKNAAVKQGPPPVEQRAAKKSDEPAMDVKESPAPPLELRRITFRTADEGVGLTASGRAWATHDGGQTWTSATTSYQSAEYEKLNRDPRVTQRGALTWTVTSDGQITCSANWTPRVVVAAPGALNAIDFPNAVSGWVVGNDGRVLRSVDSGHVWYRASLTRAEAAALGPYLWFPPPLYALSLLAVATLLTVGWRWPEQRVVHKSSIEDILLSDRPLEPGDPDVLNFTSIALGLSNFLRNPRTEPPLTIAITGAWGSGKSSLMNLLRGDLRRHGIRPVWFNAWHHQTEEHLLAALLENIRSQAVPGWLSDGGFMFRWRLLMERLRHDWPKWCVIGGVFVFSAGFVATSQTFSVEGMLQLATSLLNNLGFDDGANENSRRAAADTLSALRHPSAIVAAISFLAGLIKVISALRAFAAKPSSLLLSQSSGLRLKDLGEQTSFRYHFAREFGEVTAALGARRMVVFIDDLDRCQPKQIYEMLEATNFLVSCGHCFIVLGLARERVERAIEVVFDELADLEDDGPIQTASSKARKREDADRRKRFAEHYLEKIINIEVSVPTPATEDYQRLFEIRAGGQRPPLLRRFAGMCAQGWPLAIVLATIIVLGVSGLWVGEGSRTPAPAPAPAQTVSTDVKSESAAAEDSAEKETPAAFFGDSTWSPSGWWLAPLALLLGGALFWRLNSQPAVMIFDSQEFTSALERCLPTVAEKPGTTPRSLKRFVNRVRYYAMIQRAQEPEPTQWDALIGWVRDQWLGRHQKVDTPPAAETPPSSAPLVLSKKLRRLLLGRPLPAATKFVGVVEAEPREPIGDAATGSAIREKDLITLSAWQEVKDDSQLSETLAREAAEISPEVRKHFERLRAGVNLGD